MEIVGIFYDYLGLITAISYIFMAIWKRVWSFGIFSHFGKFGS
jgi:hypothetical protein